MVFISEARENKASLAWENPEHLKIMGNQGEAFVKTNPLEVDWEL